MPSHFADVEADIQLGHVELPRATLTRSGITLTELVDSLSDVEIDDPNQLAALPRAGWILIEENIDSLERRRRSWAAPIGGDHSGPWVLISALTGPSGRRVSVNPGPLPIRPARRIRRTGLSLTLSLDRDTLPRGTPLRVAASLTNTAESQSYADGMDSLQALGFVLRDGMPFGHRSALLPFGEAVPRLAPGASASVPVSVSFDLLATLTPGVYQLRAFLPDLDLRSETADLFVEDA